METIYNLAKICENIWKHKQTNLNLVGRGFEVVKVIADLIQRGTSRSSAKCDSSFESGSPVKTFRESPRHIQ